MGLDLTAGHSTQRAARLHPQCIGSARTGPALRPGYATV